MKKISAKHIFLKSNRFDLIFKYLYLNYKDHCGDGDHFFRRLYAEHLRAFNKFIEYDENKNLVKQDEQEFVNSFDALYADIQTNGFKPEGAILLDHAGNLVNGAHRLICCYQLGLEVMATEYEDMSDYDYVYFRKRKIDADMADFAALEWVKLNPQAYVVSLHARTNPKYDSNVTEMLSRHGRIFYKKDIHLTRYGYINSKIISYKDDDWIGNAKNAFKGAVKHAELSMGKYPLRVFVFLCDNLNGTVKAKDEIRDFYKIGNFSVHINDTHAEAMRLAEAYLNKNSLQFINSVPYVHMHQTIDEQIEYLHNYVAANKLDRNNLCIVGSYPLGLYNLRKARDLDFIYISEDIPDTGSKPVSFNPDGLKVHPKAKHEVIYNPENYFYYGGFKVITLKLLKEYKKIRGEYPKDMRDIKLIDRFNRTKKLGVGWKNRFLYWLRTRVRP